MKKLPVRDRLIETASQLFYEQGYNRTGINEILEKSGVAKASMYQHFRSKEEICLEFLRLMDHDFMVKLNQSIKNYPKGGKRVLSLFDFLLDFYHQDGFRGCWCLNTISELPKDDKQIMSEIRTQKDRFRAWIKKLVEDNLSIERPEILANKLYLLYEGAIVESQVYMQDWPIREAKEMAGRFIEI